MLLISFLIALTLTGFSCESASGQQPDSAAPSPNSQPRTAPGTRQLIIHSDDAGMSHSVNLATISAMESGLVTSCSIMVPCPWFPEFATWARQHPEQDFGIHLTLNSEFSNYRWGPVAGRDRVPTLVDAEGYLHRSKEDVQKFARPAEVEIELRAQIDRALQAGIRLSHLDTHMGTVVSTDEMLEIYVRLGLDYDLPVMIMRQIDPQLAPSYPDLAAKNRHYIHLLEAESLPAIDYLFQFYEGKNHLERQKRYLDTFRTLQPGVTQMIIHCGTDDAELQAITGSHFLRGSDTRIFSDPDIRRQIEAMGIQLISWTELRKNAQKRP
ncbi:MAG: hypothetical protein RLZZ232_549 [Planctomycetota bacterium]